MNPETAGPPFNFHLFLTNLLHLLFTKTWPWWAAGIGIGLTAVGLAWFTARRLTVMGGYEDACSLAVKNPVFNPSPSRWKLWFILGLPLGGLFAGAGHWCWTWLYGRLDAVTFGVLFWKILWLLAGGFLVGFGARWAGGCVSGNSIMGVSLGNKMSIFATVAFLAVGIILANLLFRVF